MSAALRAYAEREAQRDPQGEGGSSTVASGSTTAPLVGARVLISGLLARPDLNGVVGEAIAFSPESGRYTVQVGGESLALRSKNLQVKRADEADFTPQTKVRIKGLTSKPELNECGGTVVEWNAEKERYVVRLDGSLKEMLFRGANLERDRREAWTPAMHDPATTAHIQREMQRVAEESMRNANPFAQMGIDDEMMQKINSRNQEEEV